MTGKGRSFLALALAGVGLLLGAGAAFAAALVASVDRTTVTVGETFTFTLSLTGGDSTQPPDLTPLNKDFAILDRRRTSRAATVDGKRSQVNEWILTLTPKQSGALTIPPLAVSGMTSAPVRIQVDPAAPASAQTEDKPLFIQLEVADIPAYAQSEIPVYVRIYDSLGMRSGSISQPTAEGATFTPRGDQETYLKTIGKTRYRVVEQGYTMIPQRSGPIQIQAVRLQANVPSNDGPPPSEMARLLGRANVPMPWLNGDFNRGRDVTLHSDPVTVDVKPRPAGAEGWFLPARAVTLTETWKPALSTAKAGNTLTRTITLEAVGASPNQLPPINPPDVDGVRQYVEDNTSESVLIDGQAGARLTKTISVLPSRAGDVTLPAITVGWWNTATSKQESVTLPAVSFKVAPGAAPAAPVPEPAPAATPAAPPAAVRDALPAVTAPGLWLTVLSWVQAHAYALGGAVAVLALLAFALPRLRRKPEPVARLKPVVARPARPVPGSGPQPATLRAAERDLATACRRSDPASAHRAYLTWTRIAKAEGLPRTEAMRNALGDLRSHLYGSASQTWNGAGFLSAFRAEQKSGRKGARRSSGAHLAPLYPEAG